MVDRDTRVASTSRCHLGVGGMGIWMTTTAARTRTAPSSWPGLERLAEDDRGQRDRHDGFEDRQDRRDRRPDPGQTGEEQHDGADAADQRHRRPARSSPLGAKSNCGPPCGTDANR